MTDKLGFIAHYVRTARCVIVLRRFSALAVSFVSFSLRLFRQRKAAKSFCYQDLIDAFSFEAEGTSFLV